MEMMVVLKDIHTLQERIPVNPTGGREWSKSKHVGLWMPPTGTTRFSVRASRR